MQLILPGLCVCEWFFFSLFAYFSFHQPIFLFFFFLLHRLLFDCVLDMKRLAVFIHCSVFNNAYQIKKIFFYSDTCFSEPCEFYNQLMNLFESFCSFFPSSSLRHLTLGSIFRKSWTFQSIFFKSPVFCSLPSNLRFQISFACDIIKWYDRQRQRKKPTINYRRSKIKKKKMFDDLR